MDLKCSPPANHSVWGYLSIVDRDLYPSLTEPAQMLRFKPHRSEVTGFHGDFTVVHQLPRWISCDHE